MKRSVLWLALLALTGCAAQLDVAGSEWGKSGAGINKVTLDELECARGAAEAFHTPDPIVGGLLDIARVVVEEGARTGAFNGCMSAKGYTKKG